MAGELLMLTIASSARNCRKIETGALKSSIWVRSGSISFTKGKSMDLLRKELDFERRSVILCSILLLFILYPLSLKIQRFLFNLLLY